MSNIKIIKVIAIFSIPSDPRERIFCKRLQPLKQKNLSSQHRPKKLEASRYRLSLARFLDIPDYIDEKPTCIIKANKWMMPKLV